MKISKLGIIIILSAPSLMLASDCPSPNEVQILKGVGLCKVSDPEKWSCINNSGYPTPTMSMIDFTQARYVDSSAVVESLNGSIQCRYQGDDPRHQVIVYSNQKLNKSVYELCEPKNLPSDGSCQSPEFNNWSSDVTTTSMLCTDDLSDCAFELRPQ